MMQQATQSPGKASWQYPNSLQVPLDIVGGNGFGRYPKISTEETFNMIVSDDALVDFAGYELAKEIISDAGGRELYNSTLFNHLIAIIDNGVFTISTALAVNRVGTLATESGPAYISDNLAGQIAIVDGLNVYIFNYIANTFETIAVDFLPVYITYQDTYFIAADGRTNQWRLSGNNQGTTWLADAFHVGTLQTKPTKCIATVAVDRSLIVFGKTVAEPWYDVGAQLFPYQRSNSYAIDYGTVSTQTIATGYGMLVWLGSNEKSGLAIMVSQDGSPPVQISNDGLDFIFSQIEYPENSFGFLYKLEGHIFYQFTFPQDNKSYIYDFNTKMFFTVTDENLNYHIAKRIAFFNNAYYFISFRDGNLYKMNSLITTYAGEEIPRVRVCKNIRFPDSDRFVLQNINVTTESGINSGITRIDLSISRDGGYSYGNIISKKLNALGRRKNVVNWWNLGGIENDFVPKFRFWSFGRFVIPGAYVSMYK